jgi:hypothetical protein
MTRLVRGRDLAERGKFRKPYGIPVFCGAYFSKKALMIQSRVSGQRNPYFF